MKKQRVILYVSLLMLTIMIIGTSCKKKKDPKPAPTLNVDNYDMGTDATATVDVLANDSYTGKAHLKAGGVDDYGTVSITSDNKISFTPYANFYGTVTISYTLQDDNGDGRGSLIIKRGTDSQIKTAQILELYRARPGVPSMVLMLYSYDGDTSRIYRNTYGGAEIMLLNWYNFEKISIWSDENLIPNIGTYSYSILTNGSILHKASADQSNVLLTNIENETHSAKKRDGSGYMTVNGFSFYYGTKKFVYTTKVE